MTAVLERLRANVRDGHASVRGDDRGHVRDDAHARGGDRHENVRDSSKMEEILEIYQLIIRHYIF